MKNSENPPLLAALNENRIPPPPSFVKDGGGSTIFGSWKPLHLQAKNEDQQKYLDIILVYLEIYLNMDRNEVEFVHFYGIKIA